VITVVGFSPAVDVTYTLEKLVPGASQRVSTKTSKAGGKAVNVASVLTTLGVANNVVLPLGGSSGKFILEDLARRGISVTKFPIASPSRTCVAIVAQEATVLNEPASALTESEYSEFEELVKKEVLGSRIVIFSGSIPANYSQDRFGKLVEDIKKTSKTVLVDCSGDWLVTAASSGADFLKPNESELAEVFPNLSDSQALEKLLELGASSVYLSLGEGGGRYKNDNEDVLVQVPKLSGNATGAGDAFVAGFASALDQDLTLEEKLILASACAGAAVINDTAGEVDLEVVKSLTPQVKVVSK
jgi:1-phosphofructokinase family hexose kinase